MACSKWFPFHPPLLWQWSLTSRHTQTSNHLGTSWERLSPGGISTGFHVLLQPIFTSQRTDDKDQLQWGRKQMPGTLRWWAIWYWSWKAACVLQPNSDIFCVQSVEKSDTSLWNACGFRWKSWSDVMQTQMLCEKMCTYGFPVCLDF